MIELFIYLFVTKVSISETITSKSDGSDSFVLSNLSPLIIGDQSNFLSVLHSAVCGRLG